MFFKLRKLFFYFSSKTLLGLEIFKCKKFAILNFMMLSNALGQNKNYILLNNFRGKYILVMKFAQFI